VVKERSDQSEYYSKREAFKTKNMQGEKRLSRPIG